jgi:hypothetical protein
MRDLARVVEDQVQNKFCTIIFAGICKFRVANYFPGSKYLEQLETKNRYPVQQSPGYVRQANEQVHRPEGRGGYGGDAPPHHEQTYPASHKETHLHIEVCANA